MRGRCASSTLRRAVAALLLDDLGLGVAPRSRLRDSFFAGLPSMLVSGLMLRLAERPLGRMIDEVRANEAGHQGSTQP